MQMLLQNKFTRDETMTMIIKTLLLHSFLNEIFLTNQAQATPNRWPTLLNLPKEQSNGSMIPSDIWKSTRNETYAAPFLGNTITKVAKRVSLQSSCTLTVAKESKYYFSNKVLKKSYNFMYLRLQFNNLSDIAETKDVINGLDWIWTYKGEGGAHQYLYLPGDFGYLSFGILWLHTRIKPMYIDINTSGNCSQIRIGTHKTDKLIGDALGEMTEPIAAQSVKYNYSYWCYNNRWLIPSSVLYKLCRNSVCTFQTFEYKCCKYVTFVNKTRVVQCNKDHYHFGVLWWMFPIIIGTMLFVFYPIFLTKIAMKFSTWSRAIRSRTYMASRLTAVADMTNGFSTDTHAFRKYNFVTLKGDFPISFMSTIFSPVYHWDCKGPFISRVLRLWLIICPVAICTTRVCLDYMYAGYLVKGAVEKGALVGFSSLIAGPKAATKVFLLWFNGPITAISIFLAFSGALVVFPKRLDECLTKGLPGNNIEYVLLFKMPLKLRERFSSISIRKHVGYKRLHNLLVAQTFMLLHWKFWRQALKLFCVRWTNVIFPAISSNVVLTAIFCIALFPIYLIFCFLELIFTVFYFAFPVVNSFFIVLKAFIKEYFALFQNRGVCLKLIRNILILPLVGLLLLSWYMYCIIFFDAFWFLSKIAMFTYAGIIAYPKVSYGYMILCLMSVFYMIESANAFGDSYKNLLKVCIDVIGKIPERHGDDPSLRGIPFDDIVDKHSINRHVFLHIVNKLQPRRNQVMITLMKFVSIITILTISVELLITFDKVQELSLVSHVFTVLFVCALPKIIRVMCTRHSQMKTKRRLRANIKQTFMSFIKSRKNSTDDWVYASIHSRYESISDSESDDNSIDVNNEM